MGKGRGNKLQFQHPAHIPLIHASNSRITLIPSNIRTDDVSKALLLHLAAALFVAPAGVGRGDVDEGVGFVPGGEVGVDVALYGAQRAGDEGEDAGDF